MHTDLSKRRQHDVGSLVRNPKSLRCTVVVHASHASRIEEEQWLDFTNKRTFDSTNQSNAVLHQPGVDSTPRLAFFRAAADILDRVTAAAAAGAKMQGARRHDGGAQLKLACIRTPSAKRDTPRSAGNGSGTPSCPESQIQTLPIPH